MINTALIFAAGKGARMEEFTENTPKPLLFVWGKTLIDHILTKLVAYGIKRVIVNTHYLSNQVEEHLSLWKNRFEDVILLREETLLDTGGTLASAREFVEDHPFFAINGDVLWQERSGPSLGYLDQLWDQRKKPVLALIPREKAWGYEGRGDFFCNNQGEVELKPHKRALAPYVFGGIQIVDPYYLDPGFLEALRLTPPFPATDLWSKLIKDKALLGCVFPDPWYHIGDKKALKAVAYL